MVDNEHTVSDNEGIKERVFAPGDGGGRTDGDTYHSVRCPSCNRLLFKVRGLAAIETICPKCKAKVIWPSLDAVKV